MKVYNVKLKLKRLENNKIEEHDIYFKRWLNSSDEVMDKLKDEFLFNPDKIILHHSILVMEFDGISLSGVIRPQGLYDDHGDWDSMILIDKLSLDTVLYDLGIVNKKVVVSIKILDDEVVKLPRYDITELNRSLEFATLEITLDSVSNTRILNVIE